MDAMESNDLDTAAVAAGLRREAAVIERLLTALPVDNQVDEGIRSSLQEAARAQEHLLLYAFLIEHSEDLARHVDEIQSEIRNGELKPGHSLQEAIAHFG